MQEKSLGDYLALFSNDGTRALIVETLNDVGVHGVVAYVNNGLTLNARFGPGCMLKTLEEAAGSAAGDEGALTTPLYFYRKDAP